MQFRRTLVVLVCVFVLSIVVVSASDVKINGYSTLTNNSPIPISQITSLQSVLNSKINQSNVITCGAGEYSRWNGTHFECYSDTGGSISTDPLIVTNISGKGWYNESQYWNFTRLNITTGIFEIRDPTTGNVSFGHIPYNRYDNGTGIELFPALNGSRVGISFFTYPESSYDDGTAGNLRPFSINVHGAREDDRYTSFENHVTFYSLDEYNNMNKVIQWNWGTPKPNFPNSGWDGNLTILQNLTILRGLYVGGSSVPQYKYLSESKQPNFEVYPDIDDGTKSFGSIGNYTSGSRWTGVMRGDHYPTFVTDCNPCLPGAFGLFGFSENGYISSYVGGNNNSLFITDATRNPADVWVIFNTNASGNPSTEFKNSPVKIINTKLLVNGTEITNNKPDTFMVSPGGSINDQDIINNAISSCSGNNCVIKFISSETYTINGQILISQQNNVTLDINGATIRVADNVQLIDGRMILAVNSSNIKIINGKFDANNEHSTDPLNTDRNIIMIYNYAPFVNSNIIIKDNVFLNTSYSGFNNTINKGTSGVTIQGSGRFEDISITNNVFKNVGNAIFGDTTGGIHGLVVSNNLLDYHAIFVHGIDIRDNGDNYADVRNSNVVVSNNYINLHQQPNSITPGGEMGIYVKANVSNIIGNTITQTGLEGIVVMGKHITISSNSIENSGDNGISLWICDYCVVTGNTIDNSYFDGISPWASHNVLVEGNVISNITNHTTFGNYGVGVHHQLEDNVENTRYIIIRNNQFVNTYGGVSIYPFGGSGSLVDPNIVVTGNDLRQVTDTKIHDPYNKISVRYNNIGDDISYADSDWDWNTYSINNFKSLSSYDYDPITNFSVKVEGINPKVWLNGTYPFYEASGSGSGFGGYGWNYEGQPRMYWAQLNAYNFLQDSSGTSDHMIYRIYNNISNVPKFQMYYPLEVNHSKVTIPNGADANKDGFLVSAGDIYFSTDTGKLYIHNGTAVVSSQFS